MNRHAFLLLSRYATTTGLRLGYTRISPHKISNRYPWNLHLPFMRSP
jgi:hypothetical protein